MSNQGQGFGIVACVAAVVSAFRDADILIERLKVKRAAKNAPLPPDQLQDVISGTPDEIEREKKRGIDRFGDLFDKGDHIAIIEIQQVTIQLQVGLLERLRKAMEDDDFGDFLSLQDLTDTARDSVMSALIGLRKRLLQSTPVAETPAAHQPPFQPSPPLTPSPLHVPLRSPPLRQTTLRATPTQELPSTVASPVDHYQQQTPGDASSPKERMQISSPNVSVQQGPSDVSRGHRDHSRHSVLGFLRRPSSAASPVELQAEDDRNSSKRSSAWSTATQRSSQPFDSIPETPDLAYRQAEYDQFQIHQVVSPVQDVPRTPARRSDSERSTVSSAKSTAPTSSSGRSIHPRVIPSRPLALTTPSSDNNFLGFCKGAWKIQNDDPKATIERRDFAMSAQAHITYPSCSKCAFKGHVNSQIIWKKVHTDEARGIKYRWALLAKSHVKQRSVTDLNYGYQCLFCIFQGQERVVYTLNTYLDHISREHRGQALDDVLLYRTRCINDRVCKDTEKFDVNLFPIVAVGDDGGDLKSDALSHELDATIPVWELAA